MEIYQGVLPEGMLIRRRVPEHAADRGENLRVLHVEGEEFTQALANTFKALGEKMKQSLDRDKDQEVIGVAVEVFALLAVCLDYIGLDPDEVNLAELQNIAVTTSGDYEEPGVYKIEEENGRTS